MPSVRHGCPRRAFRGGPGRRVDATQVRPAGRPARAHTAPSDRYARESTMPLKPPVELGFDAALQHAINADKFAQSDPTHAASELAKSMQALIKATRAQLETIENGIDMLAGDRRPR